MAVSALPDINPAPDIALMVAANARNGQQRRNALQES